MTSHPRRRMHHLALAALAVGGSLLAGCKPGTTAGNGATPQATASIASPCGQLAPTQTSALPATPGSNQAEIDCTAWQAFIALNWKADPAKPGFPDPAATWASFGTPGDQSQTVWETYLEASAVFGGDGKTLKGMWQSKRPAVKRLSRISKLNALDLSDITQAGGGNHWLTNQRGDITYYEVMMNQDEFEFITQEGFDLTTAAGQLACATQPGQPVSDGPPIKPPYPPGTVLRGGINFPAGSGDGWDDTDCTGAVKGFGQDVGAIEIKAAWTPLPADHSLDYRYKTAQAEILDPKTKTMRKVTVGLVGLHIARKRFPRLPWIWATFEQIDNTPDEGPNGGFTAPSFPANPNQKPSPGYTFFNPNCTQGSDPTYGCKHNFPPIPCGPGTGICMPYNAPMQITRIRPVGQTANDVTAYVWNMLPANSVFNYYRLVDVQWPQTGIGKTVPGPGLRTPLTMGNPSPAGAAGGPTQVVANTTMESFQQNSNACMDCHVFAPIATASAVQTNGLRKVAKPSAGTSPYASDYSFTFIAETKR